MHFDIIIIMLIWSLVSLLWVSFVAIFFCFHLYKNDISFIFFFCEKDAFIKIMHCGFVMRWFTTHFVKSLWFKVWFDIFDTLFTTFVKFLSPMDLIIYYIAHCEDWWGDQKMYHHWNDKVDLSNNLSPLWKWKHNLHSWWTKKLMLSEK